MYLKATWSLWDPLIGAPCCGSGRGSSYLNMNIGSPDEGSCIQCLSSTSPMQFQHAIILNPDLRLILVYSKQEQEFIATSLKLAIMWPAYVILVEVRHQHEVQRRPQLQAPGPKPPEVLDSPASRGSWAANHESPHEMNTQRLYCSSFLVLTYFLLRDYNVLPEKELHWSPWVYSAQQTYAHRLCVSVCLHKSLSISISLSLSLSLSVALYIYIHIHICVCTCARMYVSMYVRTDVRMCMWVDIQTYILMYVYICRHMYTCVYIHICSHVT